jgi:hypothetical protein
MRLKQVILNKHKIQEIVSEDGAIVYLVVVEIISEGLIKNIYDVLKQRKTLVFWDFILSHANELWVLRRELFF